MIFFPMNRVLIYMSDASADGKFHCIRTCNTCNCFYSAGGQNVNKVSTAVMVRHVPSGVSVNAQDTRSQSMNRQLAWTRVMDAIEVLYAHRSGRNAADDRIVEYIAAAADSKGLEVVTSDRDLAARARSLGAQVSGPQPLLAALDRADAETN